jgi:hypothetical protein
MTANRYSWSQSGMVRDDNGSFVLASDAAASEMAVPQRLIELIIQSRDEGWYEDAIEWGEVAELLVPLRAALTAKEKGE